MPQKYDTHSHPLRKDCVRAAAILIATNQIGVTVELPSWLYEVAIMTDPAK